MSNKDENEHEEIRQKLIEIARRYQKAGDLNSELVIRNVIRDLFRLPPSEVEAMAREVDEN